MTVIEFIEKQGFSHKRRGEELIMNCPFCGDTERKFSINMFSGAFNCLHLNRCGEKGSFYEFQKKLGCKPVKLNGGRFYNTERRSYSKPTVKLSGPINSVVQYLASRGFSKDTIEYFKFGSINGDTAVIPFYRNGELVMVKYRSITDKKKMWVEKNTEPILFNRDNIEKSSLVITEGEYDAAALHQYGVEAVSVPMGAGNFQWLEGEWDYVQSFDTIYLCFDNDQAGQEAAAKLAVKIGEYKCKLVKLPSKDANKCLMDKIPAEQIVSAFVSAEDMKPEDIVDPSYFEEKIQQIFVKGPMMFGTSTPWRRLNGILKGWRDGEVTVWSGRNGSGKSTILNQVFIDLAKRAVKSCIYSGEMPPERYLRWAIIQYLKNDYPAPARIKEVLDWLSTKVKILNVTSGIDQKTLLSDFEYAARRYGVKHFFIDSLMKIKFPGVSEYQEQHDFMSSLCGFAKKHSCHIHLVAHPRKTVSDDDETGKVDVKGSSHITDECDNVIVLYRVSEAQKESARKKHLIPADMKLIVKKNREFGVEGGINMAFDEQTKTFSDGEEERDLKEGYV